MSKATARVNAWAALVGLAAASAMAQETSPVPSQMSAQSSEAPLYTADDLMFLTHMIVHHEQALELCALVPAKGTHEEFIRYARYLDGAQRAEIDQMKGLLELAKQRGLEIPHHDMTGDPPMRGMLSKAQVQAIRAASGTEFERLWLEGMIAHHEGALGMARLQQQRQFETSHRPYGLDMLADDIIEVQRGEIHKMKSWLAQWGLQRPRP